MKLKNVKVGQRVQVKALPAGRHDYVEGQLGTVKSTTLHSNFGMCAGEPSDSPVRISFDNGSEYWVNLKRLRKVK